MSLCQSSEANSKLMGLKFIFGVARPRATLPAGHLRGSAAQLKLKILELFVELFNI